MHAWAEINLSSLLYYCAGISKSSSGKADNSLFEPWFDGFPDPISSPMDPSQYKQVNTINGS
jgi:hypothetical protein